MTTCPNVNLAEWKTLEAGVGQFEAYRDYVETKGQIRTPEEVEAKLNKRKVDVEPSLEGSLVNPSMEQVQEALEGPTQPFLGTSTSQMRNVRGLELADKMSAALGVEYYSISEQQAIELTAKTQEKWNGEPAFFVGGVVYFVKDKMSADNVFHEFSHPVVRALSKENPALFHKLYQSLIATTEGRDILHEVTDIYGALEEDYLKEEVIVRALTAEGKRKLGQEETPRDLKKVINDILYNIKQYLRKVFGKGISISKLSTDTSLDTLADILSKGDKITIDTTLISEEDVVAYNKDLQKQIAEELETGVHEDQLKHQVDEFYNVISDHVNKLLKSRNYSELVDILKDQYLRGDLTEIKSNLSKHRSKIELAAKELLNDVDGTKDRAAALTNSLFRLEKVMEKIQKHLVNVEGRPDSEEKVHKAYYYKKMVDHWGIFIKEVGLVLKDRKNDVASDSEVVKLVSRIENNVAKSRQIINDMQAEGARDVLYEQLLPMNEYLATKYTNMIETLEKNEAPQYKIDELYEQYYGVTSEEFIKFKSLLQEEKSANLSKEKRLELGVLTDKTNKGIYIDKEKIERLLASEAGDANMFNSYLEGYLYNTDPIVSGLALYTKNKLTEMQIVTQKKMNTFAQDIKDDMRKAGVNHNNEGELGKKIYFEDEILRQDPDTKKWAKAKVWSFLSPFKNHRHDYDVMHSAMTEAEDQWQDTASDADSEAYIVAKHAFEKFKRDYMHQEYVSEYYQPQELLEKDALGRAAASVREEWTARMRAASQTNLSENEQLEEEHLSEQDLLWKDHATMHSMYNRDGSAKSTLADPKTGISPAAVAERLREYRDATRKFREDRLNNGVFENTYSKFLQELRQKNVEEDSEDWNNSVGQWKKINTRTAIKPTFYEQRQVILDKITEILSKLGDSEAKSINQGLIHEKINNLKAGHKDEDGQPIATEMTAGSIQAIKDLQYELEEVKKAGIKKTGLTQAEHDDLSSMFAKIAKGTKLSDDEKARKAEYETKRKDGLTPWENAALKNEYTKLKMLASKQSTTYYAHIANEWLAKLDTTKFKTAFKIDQIDIVSAEHMLDPGIVEDFMAQSPAFTEWFEANHISKQFKNKKGEINTTYERVSVWTISVPKDKEMYETYDLKAPNGEVIETLAGLPAKKYYSKTVKTKYRTRAIPGITKDNRGSFLPKTEHEGAISNKYRNQAYYDMEANNKPMFKLLGKLKKHHLLNQEGLARNSKLYLDSPRFAKSTLERAQTIKLGRSSDDDKEKKENILTMWARSAREFVRGASDDVESGMNYNDKKNVMTMDLFDDETTGIPIAGLYDIDHNDVSTNVTLSMLRYMQSAERQKQLVKISPVIRAIQATVNQSSGLDPDQIMSNAEKSTRKAHSRFSMKGKNEHVRADAINNYIDKHFKGESQTGLGADNAFWNNATNFMFKRASFSFFAMNIPSGLKNSLGMKFQQLIEASAGQYVDHGSLQRGNVWAYKAMAELSFKGGIYEKGTKTHVLQLVDIFDPIQDRFDEKFGEEMSRTVLKDVAGFSWIYSPRKWVENQAGMQLFAGMMYKKKVDRVLPGGAIEEIDYINAWETVDGQIKLKEGIDVRYAAAPTVHQIQQGDSIESLSKKYNVPEDRITAFFKEKDVEGILADVDSIEANREYELTEFQDELKNTTDPAVQLKIQDRIDGINTKYDLEAEEQGSVTLDNTEFKFMKNRVHQVQNNMGGAYSRMDQPEMQRYLIFRFITYLRRYFTTMATNRWGFSGSIRDPKPRLNPGLGDAKMGFYIQFTKTLAQTVKHMGSNLAHLNPEEKQAALRFGSEVVFLLTSTLLMGLIFGWDDEDKGRYNKLRAKSGALPFLGVAEDPNRPFDLLGFTEVHSLHLLMQVRAENEQFNLFTGGLKHYNSLLDIKSVALGPTTDSYMQIFDDIKKIASGDDKASYSRDVGPYEWQQQGGSKFLNHMAKTFGLTGSSLDPALAIQNFQAYQSKVR